MTTIDSIEFGRLAGRLVSPEEAALVEAECEIAGVGVIGKWPLVVGRDYEDTALMCGAYSSFDQRTGRPVIRECRSQIDSQAPAALASSLLDHLIHTRHCRHPLADLHKRASGPAASGASYGEARLRDAQATAEAMLRDCERVAVPMDQVDLLSRGNCACGATGDFMISFRSGGKELAWIRACEAHEDAEVGLALSFS